jgi:hypothetical protein
MSDLSLYRYVVHVVRGIKLINTDKLSKSDPYVIVTMDTFSKRTRVIDNNLNPVWNEAFAFTLDTPHDIHLEMFDKDDQTKDDFMGFAKILHSDLMAGVRGSREGKYKALLILERVAHGQIEVEVTCRKINVDWMEKELRDSKKEIGTLHRENKMLERRLAEAQRIATIAAVAPVEQKKDTETGHPTTFEPIRRMSFNLYRQSFRLEVLVLSANNLKGANLDGKSDPFCIVKIGDQTHQTEVVKDTLEPVWKESALTFVFDKVPTGAISFTVMDWGVVNVKIGEAEIKADEFFRDAAGRVDFELDLTPKGKLHVQVLYFQMVTKGF